MKEEIPCQKCHQMKPLVQGTQWCRECQDRERTCTGCGKVSDEVEPRHSFGEYAGRLCRGCCRSYRDHCGVDQPQGDPRELHEFEAGGWPAIEGEDDSCCE